MSDKQNEPPDNNASILIIGSTIFASVRLRRNLSERTLWRLLVRRLSEHRRERDVAGRRANTG